MAKIDFLGKGDVTGHHLSVPFSTLEMDKKKSLGSSDLDGNLIIHGDNLLALKALLPRYEGKIKCVYIDPPYNTGTENWVYNDRVNSTLMKDWLRVVVDRDDQCRHDKWLCMMYPRLQMLKELLSEDGVIFISIDDNEQHHLRAIMDEIFGENNLIANIVWRKKYGGGKGANNIVDLHEYIICYAKQLSLFAGLGIKRTEKQKEIFKIEDKHSKVRGKYYIRPLKSGLAERKTLIYPIKCPDGNSIETQWMCSEKEYERLLVEDRIVFKKLKNGKYNVYKKFYEHDRGDLIIPESIIYDLAYNQNGKEEIKTIFNIKEGREVPFENAKPSKLIKILISMATSQNKEGIILDSCAGSGTTAHAVLDINKEDRGNRKFILVEFEDYADSITAERVRRVIKGVPAAKDENLKEGLGGSFAYATLGEEITHENLLSDDTMPKWSVLARHVFWLATGKTLDKKPKENKSGFVGTSNKDSIYLLYKPDTSFMQSDKAVLTGDVADELGKKRKKGERIIYYAAAAYVSQKDMEQSGIVFCQLPWAIAQRVTKEE